MAHCSVEYSAWLAAQAVTAGKRIELDIAIAVEATAKSTYDACIAQHEQGGGGP